MDEKKEKFDMMDEKKENFDMMDEKKPEGFYSTCKLVPEQNTDPIS